MRCRRWTRVFCCGRASSIRNANANAFMVLWFLFILGFGFFILLGGGLRVGGDRVGEVPYG